jgi:hypothetical protein
MAVASIFLMPSGQVIATLEEEEEAAMVINIDRGARVGYKL